MNTVGIDDIALYFPRLYFDIKDFAEYRGAQYDKLNRGLGLAAMSIPDQHEDTATMGANAVCRLLDRNPIDPRLIGRVYLGTESALDGAKPTATYILEMLEQRYEPQYGAGCLRHCDVVDMTFACIGAVDALHNTLDWVARGGVEQDRVGIVVFADHAKYELGSSGEYTQGAGAGALLIRHNPRLIEIPDLWGVSTAPAHDFFKPRRHVETRVLLEEVLDLARQVGAELSPDLISQMTRRLSSAHDEPHWLEEAHLAIHRDTPVFDGPLSNRCYIERVKEAFQRFQKSAIARGRYSPEHDEILTEQWRRIVFHLPYAFQGKRMFPDIFKYDRQGTEAWASLEAEMGPEPIQSSFDHEDAWIQARDAYRRKISKSHTFKDFVRDRIERGQRASSLIGNQYTGSIFLSLMSTLESDLIEGHDLSGAHIGFCAYGSGAKAKVFEGVVRPTWRAITERFNLFARLTERTAISHRDYERLHRGQKSRSVIPPEREFSLESVGGAGQLEGHRTYRWNA